MREIDDVSKKIFSLMTDFDKIKLDISKEKVKIVEFEDPVTHEIIETEIYPAQTAKKANIHRLALCANPLTSYMADYLDKPFYWCNMRSAATNGLAIAFSPIFATTLYLGGQDELDSLSKDLFLDWQNKPSIQTGLRYGGLTANSFYEARHFMYVVVHEVYHLIYLHIKRESIKLGGEMFSDPYKHNVANIAQDMEINRDIEATFPDLFGGCTKAIGGIWFEDFPKEDGTLFLKEPWEPIYDFLLLHPEMIAKYIDSNNGFDMDNVAQANPKGSMSKKYTPGEYAVKMGKEALQDQTKENGHLAISAAEGASLSTQYPRERLNRELKKALRTYNQTRDTRDKQLLQQVQQIADIINNAADKAEAAAKKAAQHANDPFEAGTAAIECGEEVIKIEKIMKQLQEQSQQSSGGSCKRPDPNKQGGKNPADEAIEKGKEAQKEQTAQKAQEAADKALQAADKAQQAADQAQQQAQQSGSQQDQQAANKALLAADLSQQAADAAQQAADQAQQAADQGDKSGEQQAANKAGQQAQQAGQQSNQALQLAGQQSNQGQQQNGSCQNGSCQNGSCQRPGGQGGQGQSGQSGQSGQGGQGGEGGQQSEHAAGDKAIQKGRDAQSQLTADAAQEAADAAQEAASDAQGRANAAKNAARQAAKNAASSGKYQDASAAQQAADAASDAQAAADKAQEAANAAQEAADQAQLAAEQGDKSGEQQAAKQAGQQAQKAGQNANAGADATNEAVLNAEKTGGEKSGKGGKDGSDGGQEGGQGGNPGKWVQHGDPGKFGANDIMSPEDFEKMIEDAGQRLNQEQAKNAENESVRKFLANKEKLRKAGPPTKGRSKFGKSIAEIVDEIESIVFVKSQVNWKGKLRKIFNFATKEEEKMVMSKRRMGSAETHPWYDSRYIKPKVNTDLIDDGLMQIFFLVDSSGSMWGELTTPRGERVQMFDYIFSEIISLEKECKVKHSGLAYFCTGKIDSKKNIHRWEYNDTLHKNKLLSKIRFCAGDLMQGGTDITPILKSLLDLHTKDLRKNPPTTLMIVSDGYDDYSKIESVMKDSGYSKLLKYTFFLLITDEGNYERQKKVLSDQHISEQKIIWVDSKELKK